MPKLTPGAKTTDLAPMAAQMRQSPWGRIAAAVRYAIRGVAPDTWMSPNQPMEPVAQEAYGRRFDYPVGYNLFYTPRGTELTSFGQLRALADNCDLIRLAIETRKDQMCSLRWSIVHTDADKNAEDDPRAAAVERILKCPDGVQDWETWLHCLIEDVLVIDAPAVLVQKSNGGDVIGFEVIDGALIKPLVDDKGRRPLPPSPAYQQVIKGLPAVDYTADELIYRPRNLRSHKMYGFSPVEQIMLTVNVAIRRELSQLQYYTEGNIPAAFMSVPPEWTPQQISQFQADWDTVIEGDQAYKRKVRFVPGGGKSERLREPPLKDEFDEWLARVVCFCFSLPPTAFVKQQNRSNAEQQQKTSEEEGLEPLKAWVKRLLDHLIQKHLGQADLQFQWQEDEEVDPSVQATVLTTYQKTGVFSINEIRAKLGEDPADTEGADDYLIITASGATKVSDAVEPPEPLTAALPAPGQGNGKPTEGKPPKPAEKAEHDHLHKADTSPLTPDMLKLKDAFTVALGEVRDGMLKRRLGKAAGGDGSKPDTRHIIEWAKLADELDTHPLSLAWDDYSNTMSAVAANGARAQILKLVVDDEVTPEQVSQAAHDTAAVPADQPFDMLSYRDPDATAWAEKHAADMLTSDGSGGELADATRNMIRRTLAKAVKDKLTDEQIADLLANDYAFSPERAELIARTEVRNAVGAGALAGAQRVGMKIKKWFTTDNDNACPLCLENAAAGWIPINQAFPAGAEAPLQHPRCQCSASYSRKPLN